MSRRVPKLISHSLNWLILVIIAVWQLLFPLAAAQPVYASNNGTLKVHEFGTPSGTEDNDPKVCIFNFEGFHFDPGQTGSIVIEGQGQSDGNDFGPFNNFGPADANGYYETSPYFNSDSGTAIPDGHYKATLEDNDGDKTKSKVFKVECEVEPEDGAVTVNKRVDADGDGDFGQPNVGTDDFLWGLDNETPARAMGTTASDVNVGAHEVDENSVPGYNFVGWYPTGSRQYSCANPKSTTLPVHIQVKADATTDITLCNALDRTPGNITIVKNAKPNNPQNFKFDATGQGVNDFVLDDDGNEHNFRQSSKTFNDLEPGTYSFTERDMPGWFLEGLTCSQGTSYQVDDRTVTIDLSGGQDVTCTFTNSKHARLTIIKDAQPDDDQNFDFDLYKGHKLVDSFQLDDDSDPTLPDREAFKLKPGHYSVNEGDVEGWALVDVDCDKADDVIDIGHNADLTINLKPGDDVTCTFTNKQVVLEIIKFNDQDPVPTVTGETVTYTLQIQVPEQAGNVDEVCTVDLPPENFDFVPGSWTATSNMPEHDVTADITNANAESCGTPGGPDYGSPGQWFLGNLSPGEIVTLTYQTLINGLVSPGTYPDVAFATGLAADNSEVLSNVHFARDPFVGTQVSVISPATAIPFQTLGLTLPNTASSWSWLSAVLPPLLIGGWYFVYERRKLLNGVQP